MTDRLDLHRYDAARAQERLDELVAVYLDAYAAAGPNYTEERYRRQLASHLSAP